MKISYELLANDIDQLPRAALSRRLFLVGLIFVFAGSIYLALAHSMLYTNLALISGSNFLILALAGWYGRAKQRTTPTSLGSCSIALSELGLEFSNDTVRCRAGWIAIDQVRETKSLVLIELDEPRRIIVPKRVFENDVERQEFVSMLNNKGRAFP